MTKEEAKKAGLSKEVLDFVFSKERNNRALNQEGLEIGNTLKIKGVNDKVSTFTTEELKDGEKVPVARSYVEVLTSGDRDSISIARLVGTAKRSKYFDNFSELEEEYGDNILILPRKEGDALAYINQNLKGKTLEVIAIAENCGTWNTTFYLFAVKD